MPTYEWTCHLCGTTNPPDAHACISCAFPAVATGRQIDRAREGKPAKIMIRIDWPSFLPILTRLFLAQVVVEVVLSLLDWRSTFHQIVWSITLILPALAGAYASRAGLSVVRSSLFGLPFAVIGFLHGVAVYAFGVGNRPTEWSLADEQFAFLGYLIASAMMAVVLVAVVAIGASMRLLIDRMRRARHDAV